MPTRGWLGVCLLDLGQFREAQMHLAACLRMAPRNAWILGRNILVQLELGDLDGAAQLLRRLDQLRSPKRFAAAVHIGTRLRLGAPVQPPERRYLSECLEFLDRIGDTASVIQLLRAIWPVQDLELRSRLVRALQRFRRLDEAEQRLMDMWRVWPDHPDVMANLGTVRLEMRRAAEAVPLLERALREGEDTYPRNFRRRFALARAYDGVGRSDDALRLAREAFSVARTEDEKTAVRAFLARRR
jgi:tetratricopeptide (TPR) repeat protein